VEDIRTAASYYVSKFHQSFTRRVTKISHKRHKRFDTFQRVTLAVDRFWSHNANSIITEEYSVVGRHGVL
jgi:hypothetical protein